MEHTPGCVSDCSQTAQSYPLSAQSVQPCHHSLCCMLWASHKLRRVFLIYLTADCLVPNGSTQSYTSSFAGICLRRLWGVGPGREKGIGFDVCACHQNPLPPASKLAHSSPQSAPALPRSSPSSDLSAMAEVLQVHVVHPWPLGLCAGDGVAAIPAAWA